MNTGIKTSQPGGGMDSGVVAGIESDHEIGPNRDELRALDELWIRPRVLRPKLRGVFWDGLHGRWRVETRNPLQSLAQIHHTASVTGS